LQNKLDIGKLGLTEEKRYPKLRAKKVIRHLSAFSMPCWST